MAFAKNLVGWRLNVVLIAVYAPLVRRGTVLVIQPICGAIVKVIIPASLRLCGLPDLAGLGINSMGLGFLGPQPHLL